MQTGNEYIEQTIVFILLLLKLQADSDMTTDAKRKISLTKNLDSKSSPSCSKLHFFMKRFHFQMKPIQEMYVYTNTEEALDMIDDGSKKYFPIFFFFMMSIYWTVYLFLIEDEIPMEQRQTYRPN